MRATRFHDTLLAFEIDHPELASKIDNEYISKSPHKTHVFPHTHDVLEYLAKKYELHIITNGFSEVQDVKLTNSKLKTYFNHKITSESIGVNKPDPKIFTHALRLAEAKRTESLMSSGRENTWKLCFLFSVEKLVKMWKNAGTTEIVEVHPVTIRGIVGALSSMI